MIKLKQNFLMDKQEMRQAYSESLIGIAEQDARVVVLDCDLSNSVGTKPFYKAFPERSFNCGIAEGNACSIAAGLSSVGLTPFVHSFAVFTSRRMFDQIFISCSYAGQNVKLIGCDAGIAATYNGGTHMAFEDVGLLRAVPYSTIIEPTDPLQLKCLLPQIAEHRGVDYVRLVRKNVISIYEEGSAFKLGEAALLREGADVTIIASGIMVYEALMAAQLLAEEGISARVVDMFTIKPLDVACVLESAEKTGAIVTAENHRACGGLGTAVAEVLSAHKPTVLECVGVGEVFGEVGDQTALAERFHLTKEEIVRRAKLAVARKKGL